ncbi:MAG: hypothetical protein ACJ760_01915 [Thermoleophilaceae bacterium]
MHDETEHGGPLAIGGMLVGGAIGWIVNPPMQPTDVCVEHGIGRDVFGHCPDVFSVEALVTILTFAVFCGALGAAFGWIAAQGNSGN